MILIGALEIMATKVNLSRLSNRNNAPEQHLAKFLGSDNFTLGKVQNLKYDLRTKSAEFVRRKDCN